MSPLTPHLAETAPLIARAVPWIFVVDAVMVIGALISGVALMRFRARLTVAEARRVAEITPFRQVHAGLVRARRLVVAAILITASGVFVVWTTGHLRRDLLEFFVVVIFAGVYGPIYFVVYLVEGWSGLTADRVDAILKQPSKN